MSKKIGRRDFIKTTAAAGGAAAAALPHLQGGDQGAVDRHLPRAVRADAPL